MAPFRDLARQSLEAGPSAPEYPLRGLRDASVGLGQQLRSLFRGDDAAGAAIAAVQLAFDKAGGFEVVNEGGQHGTVDRQTAGESSLCRQVVVDDHGENVV